jgi:hypothetical protein
MSMVRCTCCLSSRCDHSVCGVAKGVPEQEPSTGCRAPVPLALQRYSKEMSSCYLVFGCGDRALHVPLLHPLCVAHGKHQQCMGYPAKKKN